MANTVNVGGRELALGPGDSPLRMERVAQYAGRALEDERAHASARGGADAEELALRAALRLADELFMAQDENTRLRRDMLGLRERQFELERRCDEQQRELCTLRARLEEAAHAGAADGAGD